MLLEPDRVFATGLAEAIGGVFCFHDIPVSLSNRTIGEVKMNPALPDPWMAEDFPCQQISCPQHLIAGEFALPTTAQFSSLA